MYQQATDWDTNYPDNKFLILVNTPRIFESVITVLRPVSERINNVLTVYGSNKQEWTNELHKIIDPEQLRQTLVRPKF